MSFREMLRLVCDGNLACGLDGSPPMTTCFHSNHSAAIEDAESRGWLLGVVGPEIDLCPRCVEHLEKVSVEGAQAEE